MTRTEIDLLRELGFNLSPSTLAAIVADLNGLEVQYSPNLDMVVNIMTEAGEANVGPDEFALMVAEAEADGMPR